MLFNFDKYLVPMESEHGLEMLQLDKNTPAATEVLHGAIGTANLQEHKKESSIVNQVFSGMKNMIHKGMEMVNLIDSAKKDITNLVITEHAVLVPLETAEGTSLIILDKDTETTEAVLDTLFNAKQAKKTVKKLEKKSSKVAAKVD